MTPLRKEGDFTGEQYNFMPVESDGKLICRGYFEHDEKDVNLKNIGECDSDKIKNVLVVWFEYINGRLQVVGWYNHATVYRHLQREPYWHYIIADAGNSVLLPTDIRKKWGNYNDIIRFGRSWVKYPNAPQHKETLSETVNQIIDKIEKYDENWICKYPKKTRININKKEL